MYKSVKWVTEMARKTATKTAKKTQPEWKVGENTSTCETAKEEYCSCRCRGKLHGQPHLDDWKSEYSAFTDAEKKTNKRNALNKWREAHREYNNAYMKSWRVKRALAANAAEAKTTTKK